MDRSRRLRMQATPRGGNTTPRRRLPACVVEFNKAIVLVLSCDSITIDSCTEHSQRALALLARTMMSVSGAWNELRRQRTSSSAGCIMKFLNYRAMTPAHRMLTQTYRATLNIPLLSLLDPIDIFSPDSVLRTRPAFKSNSKKLISPKAVTWIFGEIPFFYKN